MNTFYIVGAKYLFILSPLIGAWWFFKQPKEKWRSTFIYGLCTLILTFIVAKIASHLYYDPRPFIQYGFTPLIPHAADNGFPSDHTLLVSAIAAVVTFVDIRKSFWFWLVAIVVAISRVGVGVHHPIDVTGSAIIAAVCAYAVHIVRNWYNKKHGK
jgi:undecaprenyl-diphosphatase